MALSLAMALILTKESRGKTIVANVNYRNYNEDRVAIILNIMKPKAKVYDNEWPKCSFFGIYDGHGGHTCADFLRDYLH